MSATTRLQPNGAAFCTLSHAQILEITRRLLCRATIKAMDLNTLPGSGSSGDEYPVALAALVLAAAALVVALAQALMQYLSSSDARRKCTYEAIGISAKSTKMGWDWSFWKLRVYYPLLNISKQAVLDAAFHREEYHIDAHSSPLRQLSDRDGWGWLVLEETKMDNSFLTVS